MTCSFSRSTVCRISTGTNSRMTWLVAPEKRPAMPQPAPPIWNIGRQTRLGTPGASSQVLVHSGSIQAKLALVSSAPFGRPVVPLV